MEFLTLLILVIIANSVPVLANDIFGDKWAWPLDCGLHLPDGHPLLGKAKTFRGVFLSLIITPASALLLQLDLASGMLIGIGAMVGDLLSSFCKRRLQMVPSSKALLLDQIPESLIPMLLMVWSKDLDWIIAVCISLVFMFLEMIASPLLYKLHLRDRPY